MNSVQRPPNAGSGRSSLSANHATSFFLVSGFGSGAYSAKLFAGTKQRFSGFNQPRQWGEVVLRMLVTGKPPARGGGGHAPAHHDQLAFGTGVADDWRGITGKAPGIGGRLPT